MNLINNREGKYLYKYLPFNQYSLQILIDDQLWLGSPDLLNDPFEGDFIINNYANYHNREFIELLIKKENYERYGKWKNTLYNYSIDSLLNSEFEFLNKLYEIINNSIKGTFGTTSFSKNCNSLKMWSHYANSHKGFVIIFDREKLETTIDQRNIKLIDVQYSSLSTIDINFSSGNVLIKDDSSLLTRKLFEWKSEKEVRIIKKGKFRNNKDRFLKFEFDCISGIIFGQQIVLENALTINHLIFPKKNDILVYQAMKNPDRDKIIFKKMKTIDYKKIKIKKG